MGLITWSRHDTACKFKAHCSKRHYLVLHCNSCSTTKPIWHVNLTTLFWGHNIIYNTIGPWELGLLIYQAHASHLQSYLSSILKSCISVKGRSSLCSSLTGKNDVPGTTCFLFSQRSLTIAIWNSQPHVCNCLSETVFRTKLKTSLFRSTYGS